MSDMEYAPLGSTGFLVSRLGFGASGFGNMYTDLEQPELNRTVAEAVEEFGINYFDVAPSYGSEGLAETRLGIALEGRRDRVFLATKVGRYDHGTPENPDYEFNYTAKRTRLELENSLRRLRTDYVDVYQLHDIVQSGNLDALIEETLPELEKCRKEGKIRKIGVTGAFLKEMEYVASRSESVDTVLTFGRFNLMDVSLEDFAATYRAIRNLGILNSSVTFMGILTQNHREIKGFGGQHPGPGVQKLRDAVEKAKALCARYGEDLGTVAVRFGLCCDHCADTTLIAMARTERLRQNAALFHSRNALDPELCEGLRAILDGLFPWGPEHRIGRR